MAATRAPHDRDSTHDSIRRREAGWPCARMPIRKIFAATHTQPSMNRVVRTMLKIISHQGGPGLLAMRSSINIGVAGGNKEIAREKVLDGDCMTGTQTNTGIITRSIAGTIMLCASRI